MLRGWGVLCHFVGMRLASFAFSGDMAWSKLFRLFSVCYLYSCGIISHAFTDALHAPELLDELTYVLLNCCDALLA